MRVVDVRTHVLLDPGVDPTATSSAQDTIVVEIETDEGLVGVGETDLNAWVARACIEAPGTHTMDRGLRDSLIGRDPLDPPRIWQELYVGSAMSGRRGAVVHALGALDMALWDLCGKAAGVPCWRLWGEPVRELLTPYASLQPEVSSFEDYRRTIVAWAERACEIGFRVMKLEATFSGPYVHRGLVGSDAQVIDVVAAVRAAIGSGPELLVDVQYAFDGVERALEVATGLAELGVFFLETPLWADDIDGYAELSARSPVRIAAGEWLATRHEFVELIDRGGVQVAQPDIGRVGGPSEALRVCAFAAERGRLVVPHAWKTGISAAAAAHLAVVTPHMPFFEYLPPELCSSRLRKELVREELELADGLVRAPQRPGLGIELDPDALACFEDAARAWVAAGERPAPR
jgi:L-alanine-DL-glutamate epimerase-like enolase superfamily enzyme